MVGTELFRKSWFRASAEGCTGRVTVVAPAQYNLLCILRTGCAIAVEDLHRELRKQEPPARCSNSALYQVLHRLTKKGLIKRKQDAKDVGGQSVRFFRYSITAKGQDAVRYTLFFHLIRADMPIDAMVDAVARLRPRGKKSKFEQSKKSKSSGGATSPQSSCSGVT